MEEEKLSQEEIAKQLRKPEGEGGQKVAGKMNESNAFITRLTYKIMAPKENDNILEIGPANGFFVRELVEGTPGLKYTGIDHSDDMVLDAIDLNEDLIDQNRVSFCCGISALMPYPDNTFDNVFAVNTLYFWNPPSKDLTEIKRVLKPGGKLILSIRSKESLKNMPYSMDGFILYDESELKNVVQENGFRVLNTYKEKEAHIGVMGKQVELESLIVVAEKV